jgi:hypothetical protein
MTPEQELALKNHPQFAEWNKKKDIELREALRERDISGKFNAKKPEKIRALIFYDDNSTAYEAAGIAPVSTDFTKSCRFSENFCHDFAHIGDHPTRASFEILLQWLSDLLSSKVCASHTPRYLYDVTMGRK